MRKQRAFSAATARLSAAERAVAAARMPSPRTVSPPARICLHEMPRLRRRLARLALKPRGARRVQQRQHQQQHPGDHRQNPQQPVEGEQHEQETPASTARRRTRTGRGRRQSAASPPDRQAPSPVPSARPARDPPGSGSRPAPGRRAAPGSAPRPGASTRARAWSSRPIIRNRKATMPISATSVASEREVRTRS